MASTIGTKDTTQAQEAVVANAVWVNTVLTTGIGLACIVCLTKVLSTETNFSLGGVKLSLSYAWIAMAIYTLAHAYTAILFVSSCHDLWKESTYPEYSTPLNKIRTSGGLFMRGLIPRTEKLDDDATPYAVRMRATDLTAWLAFASAAAVLFAIIDFSPNRLSFYIGYSATAIVIIALNWKIGAHWVIAVSELSVPKNKSAYHAAIEYHDDLAPMASSAKSGVAFPTSTKLLAGCSLFLFIIIYVVIWLPMSFVLWLVLGGAWIEVLRASLIFLVLFIIDFALDFSISLGYFKKKGLMSMTIGNFLALPTFATALYVVLVVFVT